jgi:hypothetical protein
MSDTPARPDAGTQVPTLVVDGIKYVREDLWMHGTEIICDKCGTGWSGPVAGERAAFRTCPSCLTAERERLEAASPDDLRKQGWAVAVHNDYRLNGERCTFWLLTRGDRCAKGEGRTDADALNEIRCALTSAGGDTAAQKTFACGCVTCICEDPVQCHGCGAKLCHKPGDECDWLNGRSAGEGPNDG